MQASRLLALLLAVPLAAGCIATPPPADAPPGTDAGAAATRLLPWTLTECTYVVGFSPVDPEAIAPYIPEGFEAYTRSIVAGMAVERVSLGVEAFVCARGSGLDGEVESLAYGSIFVGAEPPPEMGDDGSGYHMLKWNILVPDAPRRDAFLAAGLPVHDGTATVEDLPGGVRRGTLTLDGLGTFVLEMAPVQSGPPPEETPQFTEFTPSEHGGFAAWRANYAWDSETLANGRGTIRWAEGSWAAEVVGATTASGDFHAGTWSFNGTLELPAR